MVIQCTHCQSRFKLADDKLKAEGTKVRCSKCREVFTVFPEGAADTVVPPAAPAEPSPAPAPPAAPAEPVASTPESARPDEFDFGSLDLPSSGMSAGPSPASGEEDRSAAAVIDEFAFDADALSTVTSAEAAPPPDLTSQETEPAAFGEFDFNSEPPPAVASGTGVDFSAEAFGEISFDSAAATAPVAAPENTGDSFSDTGFGEISFDSVETSTAAPDHFASADFDEDSFDSATSSTDEATAGPAFDEFSFEETAAAPSSAPTGDAIPADAFDFGEANASSFSFDEESPTSAPAFDFEAPTFDAPPSQAGSGTGAGFGFDSLTFGEAPAAEAASVVTAPAATATPPPAPQPPAAPARAARGAGEDRTVPTPRPAPRKPLPAIPKPPRRRIAPMALLVRAVFVLFLAICGAAVYFYYNPGTIDVRKYIDELISRSAVKADKGQIRLVTRGGSYVANQHAGELFVIRSEATNEYQGTRSAIEVKGVLYAKDGKILRERNAFCGNPLPDKQLRSATFTAIEEAMGNQFGDLMSNLNIPSGGTIPCTVVFRNLPPEMAEFTVELLDSKPGAK